jgi:hypothetical protein
MFLFAFFSLLFTATYHAGIEARPGPVQSLCCESYLLVCLIIIKNKQQVRPITLCPLGCRREVPTLYCVFNRIICVTYG